jgi:thiamine biosynthesis lipoprotein
MTATAAALPASPAWRIIRGDEGSVSVAERPALGTSVRVAVWPPGHLRQVVGAVNRELADLDRQASRFRADSEVSRIHAAGGGTVEVSDGLAEAVAVALAAARWTGGLVDPTVGTAICALGYDCDFAAISSDTGTTAPAPVSVPGWRSLRLDGRLLTVPEGVLIDLGATAKAVGADRAASAAFQTVTGGGVLVSIGGDMGMAGQPPLGGWPVLVADDHRQVDPTGTAAYPVQVVRLTAGALATSSVTCRSWTRGGQRLHHIMDPRTGMPAAGPWRTVSVAAASCAEANAAATASVIAGTDATSWLAGRGLPARLVGHDGYVQLAGGWPAADGGPLTAPPARMAMP